MKSLKKIITMMGVMLMFLAACTPQGSVKVSRSDLPHDDNPSVSDDDLSALVAGNNAFAFNLYQSLRSAEGNVIFSPYSISLALAMTYAGARNKTESQMAETLHFALPQDRLHPAFNKLNITLVQPGKIQSNGGQPLQLDISNALWAEQSFTFQQPFLDLLARNYDAGLQLADFVKQSSAVRNEINHWVGDQTHQKITELIPEGVLGPLTRLVIVNAIYFKADWQNQFDPLDTKDVPFHLLDGSITQVKMMSNSFSSTPYSNGNGYKAVELNYFGNTAVMDVLVPDEGKFDEFDSQLNADDFNKILDGMKAASLSLGLPKFSFNTNSDIGAHLSALGMQDAFDPNLADFSGMTGGRNLFISKVLHQAVVTVDEKGTEASAATSVTMEATSIMLPGETLVIDRPFIFLIRDIATKQILFIGRVLNPTK